jgi:hypothetical protein
MLVMVLLDCSTGTPTVRDWRDWCSGKSENEKQKEKKKTFFNIDVLHLAKDSAFRNEEFLLIY